MLRCSCCVKLIQKWSTLVECVVALSWSSTWYSSQSILRKHGEVSNSSFWCSLQEIISFERKLVLCFHGNSKHYFYAKGLKRLKSCPSFLSTFLFDVNLNKLAQFVGAITDFLHPGLISITTFGKISIFPTLSIPTIIFTLYSETLTWPIL